MVISDLKASSVQSYPMQSVMKSPPPHRLLGMNNPEGYRVKPFSLACSQTTVLLLPSYNCAFHPHTRFYQVDAISWLCGCLAIIQVTSHWEERKLFCFDVFHIPMNSPFFPLNILKSSPSF